MFVCPSLCSCHISQSVILVFFCFPPTPSADQSKQRREVVRRKTAEYLKHAEELYQKHLAPLSNDGEKEKVHVHVRVPLCLCFPLFTPSLLSPHYPNLTFISSSNNFFLQPSVVHCICMYLYLTCTSLCSRKCLVHCICVLQINQLEQLPPPPSSKPHLLPDFKVVGIIGKVLHTHTHTPIHTQYHKATLT